MARFASPSPWRGAFGRDNWSEIASTLRRNKLRGVLTGFGVFWGIFMLVSMVGLGNGLRNRASRSMGDLGMRRVFLWGQRTTMPHAGLPPGRLVRLNNADVDAAAAVPGVAVVAPRTQLSAWRTGVKVKVGAKTSSGTVLGVTPELLTVEPLTIKAGRFLDPLDLAEKRKVAVLGDQVRRTFFPDSDAVGRDIRVQGVHFTVVGTFKSLLSGDADASIMVPFTTYQTAFHEMDKVDWIAMSVKPDASTVDVEQRVRDALSRRHRLAAEDKQALGTYNAAEAVARVERLFDRIRLFVWCVGVLTLLAGILGVSNILLITVKERTKEFGIRRAIGATPATIVTLVLEEALGLTTLAGYAGLVAAVATLEGLARWVAKIPNAPLSQPQVDLRAALGAVGILVLSGLVASLVPALQASRIRPVEALRAE